MPRAAPKPSCPRDDSKEWSGGHPLGGPPIERQHSSDREIADAVIAGDRDAFRAIVEREASAVIAACRRILDDSAEAEDVVQEAFVAAYRALASYRADGTLGAWVTRIALRLALRRLRQRARMVIPNVLEPAWAGPATADRLDPAHLAIEAEQARSLRAAVATLPAHYREVVALRFFGELSLQEIATMTGRPLGTVKTHLHRGLSRLRDQVGADA